MIEVRIAGRGRVCDGEPTEEPATEATCDLCGEEAEMVVSVAADRFACKSCLRQRLEATTVAGWLLRAPGDRGLPWGKNAG